VKNLIVGVNLKPYGRAYYHIAKRFVAHMPEYFDYIETNEIESIQNIKEKYNTTILICQIPALYNIKVNAVALKNVKHTFYVRAEHAMSIINTCTNGFYYYLKNTNIKNYIPIITDYDNNKKPDSITLGFYARLWSHYDAYKAFCDLVNSLKFKVNVYIMGQNIAPKFKHVNSIKHTYDKDEFFNNITHYIYPTSSFVDPFPHSLLEAVQAGKQIVIPTTDRDFKDGIDDIKEIIKWHPKLNLDKYYDNSNCSLTFSNFRKFYKKVIENDFNYEFNREKYTNFSDWLNGEVL
jgi:hypothetical protein